MAGSKLMQGTKALTLATLISKIIGFLYIIPFAPLVGEQGLALYQMGYMPYGIMIALATMGVPVALSKYVSKYHALGDYHTAHRLFKSGIPLMLLMGFIAFWILFLGARCWRRLVIHRVKRNNTCLMTLCSSFAWLASHYLSFLLCL